MTAASARDATAEVLAFIGDSSAWCGELEQFTETLYREIYGQPGDVVDVPDVADDGRGDGACAACIGTGRESGGGVCPACDGTGEAPSGYAVEEAIQPTNASAGGFRLAGDGETAGWIVRTGDRDVAAGASPAEAADRARSIGHGGGVVSPATVDELDALNLPPSALGTAGAAPWWRPAPAPVAPEGDPERPARADGARCRERVMSRLVECPRCDGFGLIDIDIPQGNLPRDTPSSRPCPRCGGLEVLDADEDGRPLDDWPARDMGGRLPMAGDWREPGR